MRTDESVQWSSGKARGWWTRWGIINVEERHQESRKTTSSNWPADWFETGIRGYQHHWARGTSNESNNWLHAYARTAERESFYCSRLNRISTAALTGRRKGNAMAAAGRMNKRRCQQIWEWCTNRKSDLQDAQRQYQQICKRKRQKWLDCRSWMHGQSQAASWLQSTRKDETRRRN